MNQVIAKLPLPPPLAITYDAVDKVDTNTDDIVVDNQGKILRRYVTFTNFAKFAIDSYNHFVTYAIPNILRDKEIMLKVGLLTLYIRFDDISWVRPRTASVVPGKNADIPMTPRIARDRGLNYAAHMYARVTLLEKLGNGVVSPVAVAERQYMGDIPIVLGSINCYLHNKTYEELLKMGECPHDPMGYCIVSGKEKCVINQEKMAFNTIFIQEVKNKDNNKIEKSCKINMWTPKGSMVANITYGKNNVIRLTGGSLITSGKHLNIFFIYYILFNNAATFNADDIVNFALRFTKDVNRTRIRAYLQRSLLRFKNKPDKRYHIVNVLRNIEDFKTLDKQQITLSYLYYVFKRDLFPMMNSSPDMHIMAQLSIMVMRLCEYAIGVRSMDDLNSWGMKNVRPIGKMMETLYRAIWNHNIDSAKELFNKKSNLNNSTILHNFKMAMAPENISREMAESFTSSYWGVSGKNQKTNITATVDRVSIIDTYSQIMRVSINSNAEDRRQDPRRVQMSQLGFIDASDTPERKQCGFVKYMCVTAGLSLEDHNNAIYLAYLMADSNYIMTYVYPAIRAAQNTEYNTKCVVNKELLGYCNINEVSQKLASWKQRNDKVIVGMSGSDVHIIWPINDLVDKTGIVKTHNDVCLFNGKFIGWCNLKILEQEVIKWRREGKVSRDTRVCPDENTLLINTDSNRINRPLLIVNTSGELVIEEKKLWGATFNVLLQEQCVEYIDAREQEFRYIAQTLDYLYSYQREYKELIENNRAITLQTEKAELIAQKANSEALALYKDIKDFTIAQLKEKSEDAKRALERFNARGKYTHCELSPDAILSVSASIIPMPERETSARTTFQCKMGRQAMGIYHSNHLLRFDGTVKLLAYPSRSLMETHLYRSLGLVQLPTGQTVTLWVCPWSGWDQEDAIILNQASVDKGLFRYMVYFDYEIKVDTINYMLGIPNLDPKSPNAQHTKTLTKTGLPAIGTNIQSGDYVIGVMKRGDDGQLKDKSVKADIGKGGIVSRVLRTINSESGYTIRVKLRQVRIPIVGDKIASRYSQKGIIARIMKMVDMPFDPRTGNAPDVIINPHSIPSRMTVNKLIEIITSKVMVIRGERYNATAFRPYNLDTFRDELRRHGYAPHGKIQVYNGETGLPMEAMIYEGPCYYQALTHNVLDKFQMRAEGPILAASHLPRGGRSSGSGLQFGKHETTALIGHGAVHNLQERLMILSDPAYAIVCKQCGRDIKSNPDANTMICVSCTPSMSATDVLARRVLIPYSVRRIITTLGGLGMQLRMKPVS